MVLYTQAEDKIKEFKIDFNSKESEKELINYIYNLLIKIDDLESDIENREEEIYELEDNVDNLYNKIEDLENTIESGKV